MIKIIQILIAFFFPPVSVILQRGFGLQLLLNIVLVLAFYLPGSIHALYLLLTDDS